MTRRPPILPFGLLEAGAAMLTAAAGLWSFAMAQPMAEGAICGLRQAAQPGLHCGWCQVAIVLAVSGVATLVMATRASGVVSRVLQRR